MNPTQLFGVEASSILSRYSLVGVIASGSLQAEKDIAVIKDMAADRSLTISPGQKLPYSSWVVKQVLRDSVVIKHGDQEARVSYTSYTGPKPKQNTDEDSRTSELLNGLISVADDYNNRPVEIRPSKYSREHPVEVGPYDPTLLRRGKPAPEPGEARTEIYEARSEWVDDEEDEEFEVIGMAYQDEDEGALEDEESYDSSEEGSELEEDYEEPSPGEDLYFFD